MANFNLISSASFNPFNMQEMLVPFTAYKDAFEKSEEQYNDLADKADKFKYLSETLPEGSKARQIYEGYANDLRTQAEDFAHNGLTMGNRRALTSLKRRFQGEIGRVMQADEAMREEKKLRQSLNAQDSSRLYATDNLSIDDFLDGSNPNLYNISGNELYTRGAAAGKAASSRVFSAGDAGSTLNGYYRDYVQKLGYSRETIQKFYKDMSTIPELQMAADAILEERGVNQNLTGYNLQRARQSVINGMIDGAVYQENHNPTRDLGVLTPIEKHQIDMQNKEFELDKEKIALATLTAQAKANKSSGSGSGKYPGYTKIEYVPGRDNALPKEVDKVSGRATPVNIEIINKNGKPYYQVYAGKRNGKEENGTKLVLGTMDPDGTFELGKDIAKENPKRYDNFGKFFHQGMDGLYQWGHTYDDDYDPDNIKAILQDVMEIGENEGGEAFRNYKYYLEPDNTGYSNQGGGFYREPMERLTGTIFNDNNSDFIGGY